MANGEQWHLRREVTVGQIVAIVTGITAVAAGYFDLKQRQAVLETELKAVERRIDRNDDRFADFLADIRTRLVRIEDSLSKKQDRS